MSGESSSTHAGAVYCRAIALAVVVSVMAVMNSPLFAAITNAQTTSQKTGRRFAVRGGPAAPAVPPAGAGSGRAASSRPVRTR